MNNKLKHYLFIITLFVLLGMFSISLLTEIVCAQNSGTTLSAGTTVSKNDAHKTVGWASSFTGQTVTRTLTVSASDGKMKDVTCSADPGSEWSGSYSGSSASFTGNQKITATASDPNSPYKPSFQGTVVLTGGSGSGTQEHTYSWDVEGSYEIKEVKIKKIYVNGQDYTDGQITVLIGTTHQFAATPDPDGAPWPVEKPVWDTSPKLTVPNIDVTFHNEGTYTLTATCVNSKSVTVKVVKPEPYSIGFSGNGQITLKKNNPNNDIYQNNGDTAITNPVWIKGVKNDPAAFKMNTSVNAVIGLHLVDKLSFSGTGTLRIQKSSQSFATQNFSFPANVENAVVSVAINDVTTTPNAISSGATYTPICQIKTDENSWTSVGSMNQIFYLTYDNTIGTTTVKRIHWATSNANGTSTITDAVEQVAQALAQSPGYAYPRTFNWNAWEFLDSGQSGDCGTLASLAITCLGVVGIPATGPLLAWPSDDTVASDTTCTYKRTRVINIPCGHCSKIFSKSNQLVYVGNRYEAFFGVNAPNLIGYTVYPANGPFTSPYLYLRVLNSVTNIQYWMILNEGNLDSPAQTLITCPHCSGGILYNAEVVPLIPVP
jgi:hypothetical protein